MYKCIIGMKVGIPASTVSTKHCTTHTCSFQQIRSFFSIYNLYLFEKKTKKQQLQSTFIFMKLIIQNYLISIKPNEISKSRYRTCTRLSDKQKYSQYCFSNMSQPLNLPFPMKSKYLNICIWKCTYKKHADIYCNII